MTNETIEYLKDLKNGDTINLTKDFPDEIYGLIINLKNIGILNKNNRYGYTCDYKNHIYLSKLIELKSWAEFLNWLEEQNSNSNNFSNSTIGQVNQSPGKINSKSPITQKILDKTDKKSWLE